MKHDVRLRETREDDLAVFFEHQRDPAARHMAAFTGTDPEDRPAFLERWTRILRDTAIAKRTVLVDGEVAGHVGGFERFGQPEVTYWLGREHWGKGIATTALRAFLLEFDRRPLFARAAGDNGASIRVLEKCGFAVSGHERAFADARGEEIEEVVLVLE